jgi:ribonuclease D
MQALRAIPDMPGGLADRSGDEILALVERSAAEDSDYRPPAAPDEAQKALLKRMQSIVAGVARELGLANEVVASRKELSAAIIRSDTSSRVFRDWRRELVGDDLLALL